MTFKILDLKKENVYEFSFDEVLSTKGEWIKCYTPNTKELGIIFELHYCSPVYRYYLRQAKSDEHYIYRSKIKRWLIKYFQVLMS